MKHWFAVHTLARSEEKALEHLLRQGFDAWLPRIAKRRSHARRVETISAPLFPRYLFVGFDPNECQWRSINGTRGVSYLVTVAGRPVAVPDGFVMNLKWRERSDGTIDFTGPLPSPGDLLRVIEGPFADLVGRLEKLLDTERAMLLIDLLGRSVRATVSIDKVEPAA